MKTSTRLRTCWFVGTDSHAFDEARAEPESLVKICVGTQCVDLYWILPIHNGEYESILKNGIDVFDSAEALRAPLPPYFEPAKRGERDLVEHGHPGTADKDWTWAERKRIVENGQYPDDTRCYHKSDVKNHPLEADKAANVIPVRGGNTGHGGNNIQPELEQALKGRRLI